MLRDSDVTGEPSFNGDELFVCTSTRRVVVLHHGGVVFDIHPQMPTR